MDDSKLDRIMRSLLIYFCGLVVGGWFVLVTFLKPTPTLSLFDAIFKITALFISAVLIFNSRNP